MVSHNGYQFKIHLFSFSGSASDKIYEERKRENQAMGESHAHNFLNMEEDICEWEA